MILALPAIATASPAVRLVVSAPGCVGTCPGPVPDLTAVNSGQAFGIVVVAVDSSDMIDRSYSATLAISSTDLAASLPPALLSFEMGGRFFPNAIALRTLGPQTITVSDAAGILAPATLALSVLGPAMAIESIPTLSVRSTSLFALLLLVAGVFVSGFVLGRLNGRVRLATDPWYLLLTAVAAALFLWAWRLLRVPMGKAA